MATSPASGPGVLSAPPSGAAGGGLSGTYPNPAVAVVADAILGSGVSAAKFLRGDRTWQTLSAVPVDVQEFTAVGAGLWTKPAGVTVVAVLLVDGGNGGDAGDTTAGGTGPGFGGGRSVASYIPALFPASAFGATAALVVGAGGAGGAAPAGSGALGGASSFGGVLDLSLTGVASGFGGNGGDGGGNGGGDTAGNVGNVGGAFAATLQVGGAAGAAGAAGSGAGGAGSVGTKIARGGGGGGGGGSVAGAGGVGGVGGARGGGGGGGGEGLLAGGAGGAGGVGYVLVISW